MMKQNETVNETSYLNRADGVTDTERYLTQLARNSFLSLWCYPNIHRDENLLRKRGTKCEICDLLVVFGNHIIIFSDKTCNFQDRGELDIDWSRWYRDAIKENAKEIWGAEKWIKSHPGNIFLDKDCIHPFPIELPSAINMRVHRIVVAHGASERCMTEIGGSGSLKIMPRIIGDQHCLKHSDGGIPFAIGQIDPSKGFVHVFDDITLDIVLKTLDTISDFVTYLEKKEDFITSGKLGFAYGEEDLLALYLRTMNEKDEHDFIVSPGADRLAIEAGFWEHFKNHPQREAQLKTDEISYIWDYLIERFAGHALAGTSYSQEPKGFATHEITLRVLAREPRIRRRMLAKTLSEFIIKTPVTERKTRIFGPSRKGDPYYLFLLYPQKIDTLYSDYREDRRRLLTLYCYQLKLKFPEAEIIGIATESGIGDEKSERSEDVAYIEMPEFTHEERIMAEDAEKYLRENGLLPKRIIRVTSEKEYPDIPSLVY